MKHDDGGQAQKSGAHPGLLNRKANETSAQKIFGEALAVLRELIDEATHLQVRALKTSRRDTPDVVVLATMFPRMIKLLDSIELLARSGQAYGGRVLLRAFLEGAWGLEWMLLKDTERRGRQFYVTELRDRIAENEVFIPGTRTYERFIKDVLPERIAELVDADFEERAKTEIARIQNHIDSEPELLEISLEIDRQKKSPPDLRWFQLFEGPTSYRDLARVLNRGDEYQQFYQGLSNAVHGTYTQDHVWIEQRGLARIQAVRSISDLTAVLDLAWILGSRVYRLVLTYYRPAELEAFRKRFAPNGKVRFSVPDVEEQREMRIL